MADEKARVLTKKVKYGLFHRFAAAVALIGFLVTLVSGLMSQVPIMTIVFRSVLVVIAVGVISRVIIQLIASYEEIHSGEA